MKSTNILLFYLFFIHPVFSQPLKHDKPLAKDMVMVPMGSFEFKTDTSTQIRSVQAFWMSNEITNKEYREFTNYLSAHLNDTIFWINYNSETKTRIIEHTLNKDLIKNIIDTLALANEYKGKVDKYNLYKNYFTDNKFDNYPVVGVSQLNAKYYCIWRTNKENKEFLKKRGYYFNDYRLPVEEEWCYVKQQWKDEVTKPKDEITEVKSGNKNKLGLYNMNANVSEWTSSSGKQNGSKIIKGSSWKKELKDNERMLLDENSSSGCIGFRIVRTCNYQSN